MTKYNAKRKQQFVDLYSTGKYLIKDICAKIGINQDTYYDWKKRHSEFSEAIKKADDALIERRLLACQNSLDQLIEGFVTEDEYTEYVDDGTGKPKIKIQRITRHKQAPNLGAIIHYQTNKAPDIWANKQYLNVDARVVDEELPELTKDDLKQLAEMNGL